MAELIEAESTIVTIGLQGRHRNKDGNISPRQGNTLVSTLRKIEWGSPGLSFLHLSEMAIILPRGSRKI